MLRVADHAGGCPDRLSLESAATGSETTEIVHHGCVGEAVHGLRLKSSHEPLRADRREPITTPSAGRGPTTALPVELQPCCGVSCTIEAGCLRMKWPGMPLMEWSRCAPSRLLRRTSTTGRRGRIGQISPHSSLRPTDLEYVGHWKVAGGQQWA